jgi:chorismate dehydratase
MLFGIITLKKGVGMLFGSISYLNLLPFQVFLKRHISSNAFKMFLNYKRAVPSTINKALKRKEIHAGFISSVASRKCKCTDLGIIAYKKVYSVLLLKGENQPDPASATSNQLASVLSLQGKVLIGDEALKHYLNGGEGMDLAQAWYEETGLPFVFARLCYNKHERAVQKLANSFSHTKVKIPQYILKKEAKKRDITPKELTWYLEHINYRMDYKAKRSLKLFLTKSKRL